LINRGDAFIRFDFAHLNFTKMKIKKGQKVEECIGCGEKTKYKAIEINKLK